MKKNTNSLRELDKDVFCATANTKALTGILNEQERFCDMHHQLPFTMKEYVCDLTCYWDMPYGLHYKVTPHSSVRLFPGGGGGEIALYSG
jgi:hypothetical protein